MKDVTDSFIEPIVGDGSPKISRRRAGVKKHRLYLVGGMFDGWDWPKLAFEDREEISTTMNFTPDDGIGPTYFATHRYRLRPGGLRAYWTGLDELLVDQLSEQDQEWLSSTKKAETHGSP